MVAQPRDFPEAGRAVCSDMGDSYSSLIHRAAVTRAVTTHGDRGGRGLSLDSVSVPCKSSEHVQVLTLGAEGFPTADFKQFCSPCCFFVPFFQILRLFKKLSVHGLSILHLSLGPCEI
jgi:hypothetical protein